MRVEEAGTARGLVQGWGRCGFSTCSFCCLQQGNMCTWAVQGTERGSGLWLRMI